MEAKDWAKSAFSNIATYMSKLFARGQCIVYLQSNGPLLLGCLIIAIPLESISQTCGRVLWHAGNDYPPGPYPTPDAACRSQNGVTGPAEAWGPDAIFTNSNAAADASSWDGAPIGGYPGSSTYCSYTVTITGCGAGCPNVQHVTGGLPYVYTEPPTGQCPLQPILDCEQNSSCPQGLHKLASKTQKSTPAPSKNQGTKRKADHSAYKARCNELPPSRLTRCDLAKWQLRRNTDCRNMRRAWDDEWSPGRHSNDVARSDSAIQVLNERVATYCDRQKP